MNLGPLDRRIRIERPTVTKDATYGSPTVAWSTFATVWASVEEIMPSRGESNSNGLRIGERAERIRARYLAGVSSDMRVVYLDRANRLMKITTQAVELGRKDGIEFMTAEFTSSGDAA